MSSTRKIMGSRIRETDKALNWKWVDTRTGESGQVWFPLATVQEIHPNSVVVDAWIANQRINDGALPDSAVI